MIYKYQLIIRILKLTFFVIILLIIPVDANIYNINGTFLSFDNFQETLKESPSLLSGTLPAGQVIFFTNTHCVACQRTKDYLVNFTKEYSDITLYTYELSNSTYNHTIFDRYKKIVHRNHLSTPSIIVGNLTIEGTQDITDHLSEILTAQKELKL